MNTVVHTCQFCDGDYPCHTMQEVSEGVYRCDCQHVDTCPGCREHGACEDCGECSAAGADEQPFLCAECLTKWLDNYDGPEPDYDAVGLDEQCQRALQQKRENER